MPIRAFRRKSRRKPTTRRKKSFKFGPSRAISPKTFQFKRSKQEIVDLTQFTGQGWTASTGGGIGKTFSFSLGDINDTNDFTNLFKYYKINAVRVQMYFSNSVTANEEPNKFANTQLMIFTDINQNGVTTGSDDVLYYLDSQTSKRTVALTTARKPIDMLMRMKIANEVYNAPTSTNYTLKNPDWISTSEINTPHYGMNMLIERVDGQQLTSSYSDKQYVRFVYTYYIECKKVQ